MFTRSALRTLLPAVACVAMAVGCGRTTSDAEPADVAQSASTTITVSTATSATTSTTTSTTSSTTTSTTTTTALPEPAAETDVEVLAEFVDQHNGEHRLDGRDLTVTELDVGENKDNIPAEYFAELQQWQLFQTIGLVGPEYDRLTVGQHRINTIRGLCCPVSMWDNDDHPLLRSSVLVHELAHLADNSRGRGEELSEEDAGIAEREQIGLLAVPSEGNASRIQRLYEEELQDNGARPERFLFGWGDADVPDAMVRVWEFVYVEGQRFMQELSERGGQPFIEMAFDRPPVSSEQVYDVDAYLDQEMPLDVPEPQLPANAASLSSPLTLGSFVLQLLAEETTSRELAQELVTSWAGDAAVLYNVDGLQCVEANIVMDTSTAADELVSVLEDTSIDAQRDLQQPELVRMKRCIPTPVEDQ